MKLKARSCGFSRIKAENANLILETSMDEEGFRHLRKGLPIHLQGRFLFKKKDISSEVVIRGLGLQTSDKQIEELMNWFNLMLNQIDNLNDDI